MYIITSSVHVKTVDVLFVILSMPDTKIMVYWVVAQP
jgi:hypothetical protein